MHFDDNGGDMNTYPKDFKNQVYIVVYGIEGLSDHVDPEVYDAHEAFEIDKTKMKMLVPLDMNGKQLMNVNLDLKLGNLFKLINLSASNFHTIGSGYSKPKETATVKDPNGFRNYTTSTTMFIHSILVYHTSDNDNTGKPQLQIVPGRGSLTPHLYISLFEGLFNKNKLNFTKAISFPAKDGIRGIFITHLNGKLSIGFYYISTEIYSLKSHVVNFRSEISSGQSEERTTFFTCEKNRSSNQKLRTIFFHCIG